MIDVKVLRKQQEAEGIYSFELIHANGQPLPKFTAGAHIDVEIGPGLSRQYSLCNSPRENHRYLIAVLREPSSRGGSSAMHDLIQEGQLLSISAPRNHFPLADDAHRTLLFGGGIGITPLLAMAMELFERGAEFELHYCTRTRQRTAFCDRLAEAAFSDHVRIYYDDEPVLGHLDVNGVLGVPREQVHIYVCGPGGFMAHVLDTARELGWPENLVHREYFVAAPQNAAVAESGFEIELARSGTVLNVPEGMRTIDILWAAGIEVPVSCEQGVCGTCLTRVVSGIPDHRDSFLTDDERRANDQFTPCCSRSLTPRLVLDL